MARASSFHLQLALQPHSNNCFVSIPTDIARKVRLLSGDQQTCVLRLDWISTSVENNQIETKHEKHAFVGWRGDISGEGSNEAVYCDGQAISRYGCSETIEIPLHLARSIGLTGSSSTENTNDNIQVTSACYVTCSVAHAQIASKLEIQPYTIEDWEVGLLLLFNI